jgi:hypothetical protein
MACDTRSTRSGKKIDALFRINQKIFGAGDAIAAKTEPTVLETNIKMYA